jgi:hypothetical protein
MKWLRASACGAALVCGAVAAEAAPAPNVAALAADAAVQSKATGGLALYFVDRPGVNGQRLAAGSVAPVVVRFSGGVTPADVTDLELAGANVPRRRDGRPRIVGQGVVARLDPGAILAVAKLPRVERIALDGAPFGLVPPLETTGAEVQAHQVHPTGMPGPLDGTGVTICDSDSGVDVFHPMFFRANGGYLAWNDDNGSGAFEAAVDSVTLDGQKVPLRVLHGVATNYWEDTPLFGSDSGDYQLELDWLYADLNGNGQRDFGRNAGFDDDTPSLGEPLFVTDDVDDDGKLGPGEKIVALGSSKIRAVSFDGNLYTRGENLIDTPRLQQIDHGTGSSGVLVGGQRGFTPKLGMAPGADLLMAARVTGTDLVGLADWCVEEGARVVLHEYAPWMGYFLDGSEDLETLIDETSALGVAHVNPAGNLSGSQKLYKRVHPLGATTIAIEAPPDSPYGDFLFLGASVLWRDPSRNLAITIEDPDGNSFALPTSGWVYQPWVGGLFIYGERATSSRGTAKLDIYVFEPDLAAVIPAGSWKLQVSDPAPPGSEELEVIAFVQDEASGWGLGIHFPEHASEDHLIGHPGTADAGIAVAAYTGVGHNGGVAGTRADYSGRGFRIDGVDILSVSAPDDPVTAGYREGSEGRYFIYGGTSGASPHVAGVAALAIQAMPMATGLDVRQAIREGALVDAAVGQAPNHDYGHGKLRAYRSLYGEDPPANAAPSIAPLTATLRRGETRVFGLTVSDPDHATAALTVAVDRDYDGSYDEVITNGALEVAFDELGTHVLKLSVIDPLGAEAQALARFEVVEPGAAPHSPALDGDTMLVGRACLCAAPGAPGPGDLWFLLATPWLLGISRRMIFRQRRMV